MVFAELDDSALLAQFVAHAPRAITSILKADLLDLSAQLRVGVLRHMLVKVPVKSGAAQVSRVTCFHDE